MWAEWRAINPLKAACKTMLEQNQALKERLEVATRANRLQSGRIEDLTAALHREVTRK